MGLNVHAQTHAHSRCFLCSVPHLHRPGLLRLTAPATAWGHLSATALFSSLQPSPSVARNRPGLQDWVVSEAPIVRVQPADVQQQGRDATRTPCHAGPPACRSTANTLDRLQEALGLAPVCDKGQVNSAWPWSIRCKTPVTSVQVQSQCVFWEWWSLDAPLEERHREFRIQLGSQETQCEGGDGLTDTGTTGPRPVEAGGSESDGVSQTSPLKRRQRQTKQRVKGMNASANTVLGWERYKRRLCRAADRNVNPPVEANQASAAAAYPQEASRSPEPLALEPGQGTANGAEPPLRLGQKSRLITGGPLCFSGGAPADTGHSADRNSSLFLWAESDVLEGTAGARAVGRSPGHKAELLTHTTWRKLSGEWLGTGLHQVTITCTLRNVSLA